MELDEIRVRIDQVDEQLITLLEKRMNLSEEVASYKASCGMPILDTTREMGKLTQVGQRVNNKEYEENIKEIFLCIMNESKKLQGKRMGDERKGTDSI